MLGLFFLTAKQRCQVYCSGAFKWRPVSAVESSLHFFHTEINQTINKESEL